MMYLVAYQINDKTNDASGLVAAIRDIDGWSHYIDNVWLIATKLDTAEKVYQRLRPHIKDADWLFVTPVDRTNYRGWMPTDMWKWVDQHKYY